MNDERMKELGWEFQSPGWWWSKDIGGHFKKGAVILTRQGIVYLELTEDYFITTKKFKSVEAAIEYAEEHFFKGE
jgi:hypothetical protein